MKEDVIFVLHLLSSVFRPPSFLVFCSVFFRLHLVEHLQKAFAFLNGLVELEADLRRKAQV